MVSKVLRYVASGLAVLYGVLYGVFVIGETFADPGGAAAAGAAGALDHRTTGPQGGIRARPSAR